jgi:hypothetical protein
MPVRRPAALVLAALAAFPAATAAPEGEPEQVPPIAERTAGMEKRDGFLPLYWDARQGKVWLEIGRLGEEILHYTSLPQGVGSNDIGLDRGQIGPARVVRFERAGPRVLLVQPNQAFRAGSGEALEMRSVEESFATSVLWGFEVAAETGGRVLVDGTPFFLSDAHDVAGQLERTKQGKYALDATRSALFLPRTKGFPKNTEIEATLTFTTSGTPGSFVSSVAPSPGIVTVRAHHSFVELPGPGFTPRHADARAGYIPVAYADYSARLGTPLVKRLAIRHRLEKKDPSARVSRAVEPIVYHLDPGAPEPVRAALLDGARWWSAAFEKIGYEDAFRVEMLPADADPMDVRYNVIQWVHRATRGWSLGNAVVDPRTGEIVKGHVTLGSLRVRQDYLLAEGLLSPYAKGDEDPPELQAMALARIRQLSAHEVGHTLGLEHNFLASTEGPGGRASVMDYPHPLTKLSAGGTIDLGNAYATGVGAWDEVAIAWGYQDFPDGTDERAALDRILAEGRERGLVFLADQDARAPGTAHPEASLWDNGTDAAAELDRVMRVRRAALDRFGVHAIRNGAPLATLEETLAPLYLHHRYQAAAAAKAIGGVRYTYAHRGDGQDPLRPVPAPEQVKALDALLRTLRPAELVVPKDVLEVLPPRPDGYPMHRELFARRTGVAFDPIAPAEAAGSIVVSLLLDPDRVSRLVAQHAVDPDLPGLQTVLGRLVETTFGADAASSSYEAEVARAVRVQVVAGIERLAAGPAMPQVRAIARRKLEVLKQRLEAPASGPDELELASRAFLAAEIGRMLAGKEPEDVLLPIAVPPPGEPIGEEDPLGFPRD